MFKFKKPNQHGVWSMIVLPIAFGIAVGGFSFLHLLLYLGVLAVYFMSDQVFFYLKKEEKAERVFVYCGHFLYCCTYFVYSYRDFTT